MRLYSDEAGRRAYSCTTFPYELEHFFPVTLRAEPSEQTSPPKVVLLSSATRCGLTVLHIRAHFVRFTSGGAVSAVSQTSKQPKAHPTT